MTVVPSDVDARESSVTGADISSDTWRSGQRRPSRDPSKEALSPGLNESLIDEDRSRGGDDMRLARAADNPAPTPHLEKVLPQCDVKAPVHAGHGEPHMLPWYLVKNPHGRVTQHLPWFATVEHHTTDTAVDDAGEMTIKCTDPFRCEGRGWRLQVALAKYERFLLLCYN